MSDGRLVMAALTAADALALLARCLPVRPRSWIDELEPVGIAPLDSPAPVYSLIDACSVVVAQTGRRPPLDADLRTRLIGVSMPAGDRAQPWQDRCLAVVDLAELYR